MNVKKHSVVQIALCVLALVLSTPSFAVENFINYQGELTDASGMTIDGAVTIDFSIWNHLKEQDPNVGRLWSETQTLNAVNGIFNAQLGSVNPLTGSIDFASPNLYLEVTVDGVVLGPRTLITSTAAAFHANEADTVDGFEGVDLDQSGHVADVNSNPHNVTASQVGAASAGDITAQVGAHAALPSAHHSKTSSFIELTGLIADTQIPSTIARDTEIDWSNLANIPAGFADGVDDGGTETDPEVGTNSTNYLSKWNGSALVSSSIFDDGNVVIGRASSDPDSKLYVYNGSSGYGPGKSSIYGYRVGNISAPEGGSSWGISGVDAAIKGVSNWGNSFSAGLAGYSYLDYSYSAAVIGSKNDGSVKAMLAYKDNNNKEWAGYFYGDVATNEIFATGEIHATYDIVTDLNFLAGNDVTAVNDVRALNNVVASSNVQAGGDFTYSTPKLKKLNIPACEFQTNYTGQSILLQSAGNYLKVPPSTEQATLKVWAPLHLPHNAKLKRFTVHSYDSSLSMSLWINPAIYERTPTSATLSAMDNFDPITTLWNVSTDWVRQQSSTSFSNDIINKDNFYTVSVVLENTHTSTDSLRFYGVTIEYEVSNVD